MTRTTQPARTDRTEADETVGRAVGRPFDRVDGKVKTHGAARYAAEFSYPDLAHAALVHSTVSRGKVTRIDTAAAAAVPGVIAVLTHLNAPKLRRPRRSSLVRDLGPSVSATTVNYLNTDQVYWDGQPVAVVVAETSAAAHEAADLVEVAHQELPSALDFAAEQKNATAAKGDLSFRGGAKKGDAEAALAAAPVSLDLRYTTPPLQQNAIEPHATIAIWEGDRLTLHDTTQSIQAMRTHIAWRFAVPPANVRVISPYVGGGFGGKIGVWPVTVLTALAARAVGRPVRMVLTRKGVSRSVGGRTASAHRIALGAETDGRLTAIVHTSATGVGRVGGTLEQTTSPTRHLYRVKNVLTQQNVVVLDLLPNTWLRAPGEAIGTFVLESAMDELAHELRMDPIELRMRNEPDTDPVEGKRFSQRMLREAFAAGAERFGWAERSPEPGSMRDGRWLVGMGVATAFHTTLRLLANVAVRLAADGSVLVQCAFQEVGVGAATAQAQIAADALGVPFEAVRVEYGDSRLPAGPMAGQSTQTATVATGVLAACEELDRNLRKLARRTNTVGQSHAETLAAAGLPSIEATVGSGTRRGKLAGQARFVSRYMRDHRWSKAARGAQFCEVHVDSDTGEVRISRWLGVFDVGRVINPKMAASQLRGAIVMGIGTALSEETLVDPRNGRTMSAGLDSYYVPVHADIPPIDVTWLDEPDPTMPLGIVGLGEVGTTGVAAAIANAVFHATGKRVRDLPISLDKLM
jgi:xanthine dehydrogenase YagR molybdenum-binding subunit